MIITINSQVLAAELRLLNKIVPTKPAIAVLSHALFSADTSLRLWATDLEVGLSATCPATIASPGNVALPVARLLSLVEQFQNDDVRIAVEDGKVSVTCGAFRSRLQAMPTADLPLVPDVEGVTSSIDARALRELVARTRYAVNPAASKYGLQGALLTLAGNVAAMVATDGKRLAIATAARSGSDVKTVVPVKTLDLLTWDTGEVDITIGPKHLLFASNNRVIISRTLEGQFPAYERIIPKNNDRIAIVGRAALTAALKRVVLVSEENRATYVELALGSIELSSASAEVGAAAEVVAATYEGEPLKVCVNGSYVLDFLEAAVGSTVTLALKDAKGAMLMTDGDNHVAVVMLMRG